VARGWTLYPGNPEKISRTKESLKNTFFLFSLPFWNFWNLLRDNLAGR
jgi:hypothetical protein